MSLFSISVFIEKIVLKLNSVVNFLEIKSNSHAKFVVDSEVYFKIKEPLCYG